MASVQGQPVEGEKRTTRARILDAAADVFSSKGYHAAVVDDIAGAAGASKGAIYFHFLSKQDIFLALVTRLADSLLSDTQDAIGRQDRGIAKVDAALTSVIENLSRHRSLAKILLVSGAGLGRPFDQHLLGILDRFAAVIKENLDRAVAGGSIKPVDTTIVAYAWLGAVHEVVTRWLYTGQPDPLESALPTLRAVLLGSIGLRVEDVTQDDPPSSSLRASPRAKQSGRAGRSTSPSPVYGEADQGGEVRSSSVPSPLRGEGADGGETPRRRPSKISEGQL